MKVNPMINSRNLLELEIGFRAKVMQWLEACKNAGLDILVVSTYRDNEYQDFLYSKGRTAAGKICTNAKAGQSMHNKRKALDFCVMEGKACDWLDVKEFTQAGLLAESLGLVWAGRWNGKLKEIGHIEAQK